ncbi:hypothetical protein D3C78_20110 [compost metagenome]
MPYKNNISNKFYLRNDIEARRENASNSHANLGVSNLYQIETNKPCDLKQRVL